MIERHGSLLMSVFLLICTTFTVTKVLTVIKNEALQLLKKKSSVMIFLRRIWPVHLLWFWWSVWYGVIDNIISSRWRIPHRRILIIIFLFSHKAIEGFNYFRIKKRIFSWSEESICNSGATTKWLNSEEKANESIHGTST